MRRVVKLRRKRSRKTFFFITFILLFFVVGLLFASIHKKVTPVLLTYAESKAMKIATLLITQAVNDQVFHTMDVEDILLSDNNASQIDVNPIAVNKLLNMITNYVQEYLEKVEAGDIDSLGVTDTIFSNYDIKQLKQGVIYEIPSGVVFQNALLSNLGPKIPVRIHLVGDVTSDIETKITNYGINNAFLEIIVHVDVKMQVLLPFASKECQATTNIPLVMKIIEGDVPEIYYPYTNR